MSQEIKFFATTGQTLKARVLRHSDWAIYHRTAYTFGDTAWADSLLTCTEQIAKSYTAYSADATLPAGLYDILIYLGTSPASTDSPIQGFTIDWDGTQELGLNNVVNASGQVSVDLSSVTAVTDKLDAMIDSSNQFTADALTNVPAVDLTPITDVTDELDEMIDDGVFTAEALANAPTESADVADIREVTDKLATMIDSSNRFTADALHLAPTEVGTGSEEVVYTAEDASNNAAIAQCKVWVTTDSAGLAIVASGYTDDSGQITFWLDAGTYYVWRMKSGYNFNNPNTITVTD